MFAVVFEVHPRADQWDAYLGIAKALRPELEQVEGFIDNIRYASLTREGWLLSLSSWRDEKSVVRWRTGMRHHQAQERGRTAVFADYHLRVGEIIRDTRVPDRQRVDEQRFDETEAGDATTVTLIDAQRSAAWVKAHRAEEVAQSLGLVASAPGLVAWDVFDAILNPGDVILLASWRQKRDAEAFARGATLPEDVRLRHVRIVRDYGMFDRREAPQYFPDAKGAATIR